MEAGEVQAAGLQRVGAAGPQRVGFAALFDLSRALPHDLTRALARVAAAPLGVAAGEVLGASRVPALVRARWAIMLALQIERGWSHTRIGALIGGRDRTTVTHGLRRAAALHDSEADFAALVAVLRVVVRRPAPAGGGVAA